MVLLALCIACTCCAPPGVPLGASTSYDLWSRRFTSTWRRTFDTGCVVWFATERWADVHLVLDTRCDSLPKKRPIGGRGVSYSSSADFLAFHGYWPWTADEYFDLMEFDSRGKISRIGPCPHSLSHEQINELRALAQAALGTATTGAEKRMLTRVVERLGATNGTALASGQGGCSDLPPDWYHGEHLRQDPWAPR